MNWAEVLKVWRVLVLAIGAFDIGFAIAIAYAYLHKHLRPGSYETMKHVLAICASYVVLAATVWATIFVHAIHSDPQTFRLWSGTIAFPLGIYAMSRLVIHAKKGPAI